MNVEDINVQGLVDKAQAQRLGDNHPDYQTLERLAGSGVQAAKNALARIDRAGGARSDVSVNPVI